MSKDSGLSLTEKDKNFFFHPFTALKSHESTGGRIIVEGKGSTLTDSEGNKLLDAMAGLWCVNLGYGNTELAETIHDQVKKLSYYHSFSGMSTDLAAQLSEQIINMCPVPMSKVFFGNSGSDANDTHAKIIWFYNNALGRPQKKKIISRHRGYHGVTVLSAGLTGLTNLHEGFDLPLDMIRHVRPPHRLWEKAAGATDAEFSQTLADELEAMIIKEGPDTVAAFIAEPVQAAGGVIVPPSEYFPAIQKVLKKYDVLLIADEVVTAFGRLGKMFGAHPIAAACALKTLEIVERDNYVGMAQKQGVLLHQLLQTHFADHPLVGEIRGQGLIGAVELVADRDKPEAFDPSLKIAPRVAKRSMELGVITRALPAADTVAFSPPFIVTDSELETMVKTVRKAVDEIAKEIGRM